MPFRTEFGGDVADGGLERGLRHAHDIVVLHHHLAAVIGHGEHGAAILHQRFGQMRHPQERPARDVHRLQEAVATDVHHASVQRLLRREGDRMQQEVELAPFLLDSFEHLLHLALDHDVQRHEDRRLQCLRERLDMLLGAFVQIGDGEIGPERTKGLGAAPGDRLVVGDADDQALLALQRDLGIGKYGIFMTPSRVWRWTMAGSTAATRCAARSSVPHRSV